MLLQLKECDFIAVGQWNKSIFSAPWLGELLGVQNIGIELLIINGDANLRYVLDDIIITPIQQALSVSSKRPDLEGVQAAERAMIAVLDKLPVTPVLGIGQNLQFTADEVSDDIRGLFNGRDLAQLSGFCENYRSKELRRSLSLPGGDILNLILRLDGTSEFSVKFNYHTDVHNAQEASASIHDQSENRLDLSSRIITQCYSQTQVGDE